MARHVRGREREFVKDVDKALAVVSNAESWTGGAISPTMTELEYLYESAYMYIFARWEAFLEEAFLRFMCGFIHSASGQQVQLPIGSAYSASLQAAEAKLYKGQAYLLWHGAVTVIGRSRKHFRNGPHELVLQSALSDLDCFSAIRHRIAHDHKDAKSKFSSAALTLGGSAWRGKRAGHLLRRFVPPTATLANPSTPERWIDAIGRALKGLASQIT